MTSEPYCPVPFDAHPYENRPLDKTPPQPPKERTADRPGLTAGGVVSSVPVDPAAPNPTGTLAFHCPVCVLDYEEPFCDWCGANLTPNIDRPVQQTIPGALHGPDRSEV